MGVSTACKSMRFCSLPQIGSSIFWDLVPNLAKRLFKLKMSLSFSLSSTLLNSRVTPAACVSAD
jgi:hypothetical protein